MFTETDAKVIIEFANNNMNKTKTSEACFLCYTSIEYHLEMVHRKTGLNPRNFHDLVKLYLMAKQFLENHRENPLQMEQCVVL